MDIKLPHSLLKEFLKTRARPQTIADKLSLCGPTVDQVKKTDDDYLYQIEIITNRIDSASAFGIAREASVILPQFDIKAQLKNNPYQNKLSDLGDLPDNKPLKVQVMDSSLVPRFSAISLKNIQVKDSPSKIQQQLRLSGQRPINNIIDISNELTLKYGQPVHIFDLDKIKDQTMIVRTSKKGEQITTLDGNKLKLEGDDIIIEDGSGQLIDLCGIMGSANTKVDQDTQNVLLFVQNYDPQRIRKTSLYTQHRTLASQIFEKEPDPELVMPVLIEGAKLLQQRASAEISSSVLDIYSDQPPEKEVKISLSWLNDFVGEEISAAKIKKILKQLGFSVTGKKTLTCQVPSWRLPDINSQEDLAEEITRIYGYFRLSSHLPSTKPSPQSTDPLLERESQAKQILTHLGLTEIYNNSLVSKKLFQKSNLKLQTKFQLDNPLSQKHQYMRTSLIPSLLKNLADNRGRTQPPLHIFELANIYLPQADQQLANERSTLALATQGPDFFTTKGYLNLLADHLKVDLQYQPLTNHQPPFVRNQTAKVVSAKQTLGYLGVIDPQVTHRFQIDDPVVVAHLNFRQLSNQVDPIHHFTPVPKTSVITEDLTIETSQPVGKILKQIQSQDFIYQADFVTEYQGNYTFRLYFNNPEKNITQKQVNKLKEKLQSQLK